MEDESIFFMVATECAPEVEEKFNKWYEEVHIPMLLEMKGLKEVSRYKLVRGNNDQYPKYLATYKFENMEAYEEFENGPVLAACKEEMAETWKDNMFDINWRVAYKPMKSWVR